MGCGLGFESGFFLDDFLEGKIEAGFFWKIGGKFFKKL